MEAKIHVFRTHDQPATKYKVVLFSGLECTIRLKPRKLVRCFKCNKRRKAGNCIVHVYYDGHYFFCKKGKGCKAVR